MTAVLYLFAVACLSGAGGCFGWALRARLAVKRGDSFVGVFNRRVDRVFVGVLRKWCAETGIAGKTGVTF